MKAEFQRVKEIFLAAVEKQDAAEREAYLREACGQDEDLRRQVDALLARHEDAGSFLEPPAGSPGVTVDEQPTGEGPGTRIGSYKLLEQIGEGGFGVVFMAEQTQPVRRKVALKVLKPGMDTRQVVARFEAERQALALMDHPNIARVFDGGSTPTGRPYFVMELVKGVPITEFCDQNQLTPRQRLELFIPVCQAVQHAHQKGIIHRDLKPSNVLVSRHDTTPVVKVIDFGVAKALGHELTDKTLFTGIAQMIGTPLYMSPEQAGMSDLDADTRSDIYSLGVLLYELLAGTTPFPEERFKKAAYDEIRRIIREEEPPRPSTRLSESKDSLPTISAQRQTEPARLTKLVRGELDWIVMKCLEKDRGRRYESASNLARDVERYLHDEPVDACPPSAAYRLSKFWRKHRGPVVAVGVVLLALVSGIVGTTWGLVKASRATDVAQANAIEAVAAAEEEQRAKQEALKAQRAQAEARKIAEDERDAKDRALVRAEGLRLTAQSELVRPVNPGRALLLAIEGARRAPGLLANNALVAAMDVCAEERTLTGHEGDVVGVVFNPDGKYVLSWSADQTARLWDVQTGRQLRQLKHSAAVAFARFSPDGRRILTIAAHTGAGGPGGKSVHVWDSTSGRQVASWKAGDENQYGGEWFSVTNLASFSPDSQRVVVTYRLYPDNPPSVHETDTGKQLAVLRGHKGPVLDVNFSPDGRYVVTAALDGTAGIWDAVTGKLVRTLTGHKGGILSATFSPGGDKVLTFGDGQNHEFGPDGGHSTSFQTSTQEEVAGRIWDVATGEQRVALRWPAGQKWFVRSARFSSDGTRVLTSGYTGFPNPFSIDDQGRVPVSFPRVWDAATGKLVESFQWTAREPLNYTAAEFSPDARTVLATANGKVFQLGDAATGKERFTFRGHDENIVAAAFSPDSKRIVTAAADRTIRIWDASFAAKSAPQHRRWHDAWQIALSPDGRHILAQHQGDLLHGFLRLWEVASGLEVWSLKSRPLAQEDPMLSADGERFAVRYLNSVGVWETRTGKELFALDSREGLGGAAALSPDGKRLICRQDLARDKGTHIWDVETKKDLATLEGDTTQIRRIQFSPDGRRLLTTDSGYGRAGAGQRTTLARLFDTATGKQTGLLSREYVDVRFLGDNPPLAAFSRDGQRILTASSHEAVLWDANGCNELMVFKGHSDAVLFTALSADEKRVVTTSRDRTARLWDTATGKELHVLKGPDGAVSGAAFSPDGDRLATWENLSTVRLWDTATGKELVTWRPGNPDSRLSAQFGVDGQWLLIRSGNGVRFWPVDPLPAALQCRARELTTQEREQFEIRGPSYEDGH